MPFEPPNVEFGAPSSPLDAYRPADGRFITEPKPGANLPPPPPPYVPPIAPKTAAEASARLDVLARDKEWGKLFFGGDVNAHREFNELMAVKDTANPMAALLDGSAGSAEGQIPFMETTHDGALPMRAQVAIVADMRELGLSDGAIAQAFTGQQAQAADYHAVRLLQAQRMADKEWTARYLDGDPTAAREMLLMNIVLTNGIEGGGSRF